MKRAGASPMESYATRAARLSPAGLERLAARLDEVGADIARDAAQGPEEREILVAYYVTKTGTELPQAELRGFLGKALPDHLIPALFSRIDRIPRTGRGKVDKASLRNPRPRPTGAAATTSGGGGPATTEIQSQLIEIWTAVLGVDRIMVEDSFFEIGGDSLLGIRLLGRIRDRWHTEITMEALFDHPTLKDMASYIDAVRWARNPQVPSGPDDSEPGDREEIEI